MNYGWMVLGMLALMLTVAAQTNPVILSIATPSEIHSSHSYDVIVQVRNDGAMGNIDVSLDLHGAHINIAGTNLVHLSNVQAGGIGTATFSISPQTANMPVYEAETIGSVAVDPSNPSLRSTKESSLINIYHSEPVCGDGKCDMGETITNPMYCPADCGGSGAGLPPITGNGNNDLLLYGAGVVIALIALGAIKLRK